MLFIFKKLLHMYILEIAMRWLPPGRVSILSKQVWKGLAGSGLVLPCIARHDYI